MSCQCFFPFLDALQHHAGGSEQQCMSDRINIEQRASAFQIPEINDYDIQKLNFTINRKQDLKEKGENDSRVRCALIQK